jgi:hypothetical protein
MIRFRPSGMMGTKITTNHSRVSYELSVVARPQCGHVAARESMFLFSVVVRSDAVDRGWHELGLDVVRATKAVRTPAFHCDYYVGAGPFCVGRKRGVEGLFLLVQGDLRHGRVPARATESASGGSYARYSCNSGRRPRVCHFTSP